MLRGVAALCVLFYHALGNFWTLREAVSVFANVAVLPDSVATPPLFPILFASSGFNFGQFGVALFFLISGFVIPFSLSRFNGGGFLVARALRIYPTYAVCFTISLLAILAGGLVYGRPFPPLPLSDVVLQYFIGLRPWLGGTSIDPIAWTLEIEIYFYLLCALLAPMLRRLSLLAFVAPVALAALIWLTAGVALPGPLKTILAGICPLVIFMFAGTAFHYGQRGVLSLPATLTLAGAMTVLALVSLPPAFLAGATRTSYGAALVVFTLCYLGRSWFRRTRLTGFLADISYPLYAVHAALGAVLLRLILGAGINAYVAVALVFAALAGVSYAIHLAVERPSQNLGRRWGTASANWFRRAGSAL